MARGCVNLRVTPNVPAGDGPVTMVNLISYELILVEKARPSSAAVGASAISSRCITNSPSVSGSMPASSTTRAVRSWRSTTCWSAPSTRQGYDVANRRHRRYRARSDPDVDRVSVWARVVPIPLGGCRALCPSAAFPPMLRLGIEAPSCPLPRLFEMFCSLSLTPIA